MATFNEEMRDVAVSLIAEFGKSVVLAYQGSDNYNPETGATNQTIVRQTIKVSPPDSREAYSVDASQEGDAFVLVAAKTLSIAFTNGMTLEYDGEIQKVVSVRRVYGGPDIVVYAIGLSS